MDYKLVTNKQLIPIIHKGFSKVEVLGADIETDNTLEPQEGRIRMLQLSDGKRVILFDFKELFPYYWENLEGLKTLNVDRKKVKETLDRLKAEPEIALLRDILENKGIIKVFHNAKFDVKWLLYHLGVETEGLFDTMLASQLLDYEFNNKRHNLKAVAVEHLTTADGKGIDLNKTEQNTDWTGELTPAKCEYAAYDVYYMPRLREVLRQKLIDAQLVKAAAIEFNCILPMADMELNGKLVDRAIYEEKLQKVKKLREEAYEILQKFLLGENQKRVVQPGLFAEVEEVDKTGLNLGSHQQVAKKLQEKGVPIINKDWWEVQELYHQRTEPGMTKNEVKLLLAKCVEDVIERYEEEKKTYATGTGVDELEPLVEEFEALKPLDEYRKIDKLYTSYGQKFLMRLKNYEGHERLYYDIRQIGAPTGRSSTSNPSIQNIPDKPIKLDGKEYDIKVRQAFKARPGYVFINSDLPNIELRLMAEMSDEDNMINAFNANKDLHSDTAAIMYGVPYEECLEGHVNFAKNKGKRKHAKIVNFAIPYGVSKYGLSKRMKVSVEEAEGVITLYSKKTYPKLWRWLTANGYDAQNNLEVRTHFGRRQKFTKPKTNSEKGGIKRNGFNTPIQGTAADVMKICLRLVYDAIKPLGGKLVSVVHDEVNVEMPEQHAEEGARRISEAMTQGCKVVLKKTGIKVEAKVIDDWSGK